jgi:glycosyltransferase involved in cell wall biosynthesis
VADQPVTDDHQDLQAKMRGEPDRPLFPSEIDITFFVPCYNEEKNVRGAIDKLSAVAATLRLSHEIIVFDDCSKDGTADVVRGYQREHPDAPVQLVTCAANQGVSRNFVEGAFRGRGRHYRLVCGDDIEPIESHLALARRIGEADMIIPYFTRIEGRPFYRHAISWLFTRLVNLASGYSLHYYNGCPIYRRFDIIRYHVETTGFGYQAEMLTRLLHEGRTFIEVPLVSMDRVGSASLNMRNFLSVAHSLLKIVLRRMRVYLFD